MSQKHVATRRFPLPLLVATSVPPFMSSFNCFSLSPPPPPPPTHLTIHFSLYSNWYKSTKLESQQSLRSLYIISLHKTQRIILSTYFCNQPEEIAGSGLDALFECLFAFQISFQLSL